MRNSLRDALLEIKKPGDKIYLIVGDIGFGVFEEYSKKFKEDYLNIGICESNMIGFSSGMSMNGFLPIVYTIVPFLTMRPFEQIRIDLALHKRKVILVGVGGGLAYGNLGPTHHSFEDLTLMTILPNFAVFSPSQPSESKEALTAALNHNGPSYIRLGKNGEPDLSKFMLKGNSNLKNYCYDYKKADVTILTYGAITYECIIAAKELIKDKVNVAVVSFFKIKPLPKDILEVCFESKASLIVEEHTTYHSIGTHIASKIMQRGLRGKLKILGINDKFTEEVGSRDFLLKAHKIDSNSIVKTIREMIT